MGNNSSQIGNGHRYRIISIEPNSFGSNLNFQIFLDFIIIHIKSDQQVKTIKLLESDEPIELSIFNIFSSQTRKIYISEPRSTIKLGLFIRYESIYPLILHIIKWTQKQLRLSVKSHRYQTIDEFSDIVTGQAYSKQSIELSIFSPQTKKSPRIVVIEPKYNWGGPGSLGCEFASEVLHSFNISLLIKIQEGDKCREGLNNEDKQPNEESNQYQQIENREQNDVIINNKVNSQQELYKSIQQNKMNDTQEHSLNKSQSLISSQISESKQNIKTEVQQSNQEISDLKQQQKINQVEIKKFLQYLRNSILFELDNQQKSNLKYYYPSNLQQLQDNDIEVKGELRFQKEEQQPYLEKEEVKQTNPLDNSLQQKNDQTDQSYLEQNNNEKLVQPQSGVSLQDNDSKQVIKKSVNQIVFKLPNRDQMYLVDKQLLFDIQFEVPKYYVNIY